MEMLEKSFTAVIGLIVGGLLLAKYFMKKSISSIPIFTFPSDRSENFKMIQKDRLDPLFTSDSVTSDSVRSVPEPGGRKYRIYHSKIVQFTKKGQTLYRLCATELYQRSYYLMACFH